MSALRLVITRPQPDGESSAAALRARGHDVLLAPLMRVEPLKCDLAGNWSAIIITSANAPRAIAADPQAMKLKALPLYAVGRRSAETAREAGFTRVQSAGGDVRDLIKLIGEQSAPAAPLLYLAGVDRAAEVAGELAASGLAVKTVEVYRAAVLPFPPALIEALKAGRADAVLHFSRRSAGNYLAGAKAAGVLSAALAVRHLCLSAQVAEPLATAGAAAIEIAARPDETALIDLAGVA